MDEQLSFLAELDRASDTSCEVCDREIPTIEILEHEEKKICMDSVKKKLVDGGWKICPICNEAFAGLCSNGLCVECDYKKKHPDAKKKFCEQCIHFHYHNLYDENDHTECCCKLHLEGKNRGEWSYLCKDYVKLKTAEEIDKKYRDLCTYASVKEKEQCPDCKKKYRFLYDGICLPCYEKKVAKAEKIARGFTAEGWRPVPENERENAKYELGGWIDERNMDATEQRKGTRYFLIDIKHLTWKFLFKKV